MNTDMILHFPLLRDRHRIEHVGSTSVPGLAAKPVVDLDVVVAAADVEKAVAAIGALGYEHRGNMGIEGRHRMRWANTVTIN